MDDHKAEEIALKAMRLHIARLESEGDKPLNLAAAIELCDQFAISGMKAEDFQLNAVANLLASMAKWPQSRLGDLFRCDLEDAAEHITTHGLMAMFDA